MENRLNGREIEDIHCSCGGTYFEDDTTDDEEQEYGCSRRNCCVKAFLCNKCGVRLVFDLCAPEID